MTQREEIEQMAQSRPTRLDDDLYQWAAEAEDMLWKLAAQPVQPGWKLVPVDPTREMAKAGGLICRREEDCEMDEEPYRQVGQAVMCYMEMIAAAPIHDTKEQA